jgi:hypothetical protein
MQPQYGNLNQAHASRVLRNAFIESFAQSQMNAYEITKDQMGNYHVSEDKKDSPTIVKLDDDSLNCFKEFIDELSEKQRVFFGDETIFATVMGLWNQAHPQEETTEGGE